MMTPEQLSELQGVIDSTQNEAPVRSSELVSLRRQLDQAKKLADTIDNAFDIKPDGADAIQRLTAQMSGLIGALKDAKSKQANAEVSQDAGRKE